MTSILLVDDEPMTLRVMRQALEKDGFEIRTAFDGQDAIEKLVMSEPDVLITDIDMPRMSGKELCLKIHASLPDRAFPIFITTSLTALEHRDWSSSISNLTFVEKPVSLRKLRAAIKKLVTAPDSAAAGNAG